MEETCPSVFVATTKGTLRKHRLSTDQAVLNAGVTLWQDEHMSHIADFALTQGKSSQGEKVMHAVLAIGNGDLTALELRFDSQAQQHSCT